ncbi:hypothetical protein C21880S2P_00005 [Bacteroides phage C2_18_80S2P]|nr:hypothetical protein C21880S2P_00005 [Bacteroides phage C2_18_80S2P]
MEKFEKREAHPMEKYIGRLVNFYGKRLEVVGYSRNELTGEPLLIVEALPFGGWSALEPSDVITKECESYWYAGIKDLID